MSRESLLAALRAGPDQVRREVAGLSTAELEVSPAPGKWTITQIVAHLADLEERLWVPMRLRPLVEQDHPTLPPSIDPDAWALERRYEDTPVRIWLQRFSEARSKTIQWLASLSPEQWERTGVHPEAGELTLAQIVERIPRHDENHLNQIRRIKELF